VGGRSQWRVCGYGVTGTVAETPVQPVPPRFRRRMTGLNGLADGWRRGSGDGLEEGRCPGAFRGTLGSMTLKSSVIWFATAAILHRPCSATADPQQGPILPPPVRPACISSPFGPRVLPQHPFAGTYHYGVDLPAPAGAPVFATASGKVIRVQKKGPGGLVLAGKPVDPAPYLQVLLCARETQRNH
jgi:hypothetical protein